MSSVALSQSLGKARLFEGRFTFDTYLGAEGQTRTSGSLFNPGNRLLKIPDSFLFTDFRLNAQADVLSFFKVVLRPRMRVGQQLGLTVAGETASPGGFSDVFLNEGFLAFTPTESIELAIGRQQFQWGPAESLNPTNIFLSDLLFGVEPFYEIRGKYMARLNLSFGQNWSWISLVELDPIEDDEIESRPQLLEPNEGRVETKAEYNWDNGGKAIGIVAGRRNLRNEIPFVGGYAVLTLSDAWQLYGEARVQKGSDVHYPEEVGDIQTAESKDIIYFVGLAGARYTFNNGLEVRLEYIGNELGPAPSDSKVIRQGLADPMTQEFYLALSAQSNLPGMNFVYSSIRWNSTSTWLRYLKQPLLSMRALTSLDDGSGFVYGSFEAGLSDRWTSYLFAGSAFGETNSGFRRLIDQVGGAALRVSF